MIGPKLLSALHNIVHLPFTYSVGSASPHVLYDLSQGGGEALNFMNQALLRHGVLCGALNLCHSLVETPAYQEEIITEDLIERAMDELLIRGSLGLLRVN